MESDKKNIEHINRNVDDMYDAIVDEEEKQRIHKAIKEAQKAKGRSQPSHGKKITIIVVLTILLITAVGLGINYYSTLKAKLTQNYQRTVTSCMLKVDLNCLNHSFGDNKVTVVLGNRMPKTIYLEEVSIGNCTVDIDGSIGPTSSKEIVAQDCQLDSHKKYNLSVAYSYTKTGMVHTTKGTIGFLLGKSE